MALKSSEAILLKAFNWSESSRTVLFFTEKFGKLPLNDRGGRSFKAKRGRILPFSRLDITFYHSEKETNGYVSEVTLVEHFPLENEGTMGRLAYASAGCELLKLLLPEEEAQNQLYTYFVKFLQIIDSVDKQFLPAVFITFFLRTLSQLGYHPSIGYCVGCGKEAIKSLKPGHTVKFSGERGGIVCSSCQKAGDYYISFSFEGYKLLLALQTASLNEAASLPISLKEANQLLTAMSAFVAHQVGVSADLKSLAFIEKLKNSQT